MYLHHHVNATASNIIIIIIKDQAFPLVRHELLRTAAKN